MGPRWLTSWPPATGTKSVRAEGSRKGYFVSVVYVDPNDDDADFIQRVAAAASRHNTDIPYFICGDLQKDPRKTPHWQAILGTGLFVHILTERNPAQAYQPTYCNDTNWDRESQQTGATAIDHIIGNRAAHELASSAGIFTNLNAPGHVAP